MYFTRDKEYVFSGSWSRYRKVFVKPKQERHIVVVFTIIISFLLFPIIQFYFSPYLFIWSAYEGIITARFLVYFDRIIPGKIQCIIFEIFMLKTDFFLNEQRNPKYIKRLVLIKKCFPSGFAYRRFFMSTRIESIVFRLL